MVVNQIKIMKILFFIILALFLSCSSRELVERPLYDSWNRYIGDSVLEKNKLKKIMIQDQNYFFDSIVYDRYDNGKLKSSRTYSKGNLVFENVEYFENGEIKSYKFLDSRSGSTYQREYNSSGVNTSVIGEPFFCVVLENVLPHGTAFIGDTTYYRVFYPNPPDTDTKFYIKQKNGELYDVFRTSPAINFLQTTSHSNLKEGQYKAEILMKFKDTQKESEYECSHTITYKIIKGITGEKM